MSKTFKLGKKAASYSHKDLLMVKYVDFSKLPPIPDTFGHESVIADWKMLGNSDFGDCVWAGAAHETMLYTALGDPATASFTDANVLSDYSAVTSFNPADPATDQGTDMHDAMRYRRNVGIIDSTGTRHKIACYLWLEPGNVQQLLAATYLFGAVGVGIQFPNSAQNQFDSGKPWAVVGGAHIEGGHYIPVCAKRNNLIAVTWGRTQEMTTDFYRRYSDEAVAILSLEFLSGRKSPEGFDLRYLIKDLEVLAKLSGKSPANPS